MCVIFFVFGHRNYKLIVAANRDEFLYRPAVQAHYWAEIGAPQVLAGIDQGKIHVGDPIANKAHTHSQQIAQEYAATKYEKGTITTETPSPAALASDVSEDEKSFPSDLPRPQLQSHGTWMGTNIATGNFAFITNFREHPSLKNPTALTRGYLARDFLLSSSSHNARSYADHVHSHKFRYNGFNFVLGNVAPGQPQDKVHAFYIGNRGPVRDLEPMPLKNNVVYGLSNGVLVEGTSDWPKVERGKELLASALQNDAKDDDALITQLLSILQDKTTYPDSELPKNMYNYDLERGICPISIDRERAKGSYGTRTHTILLVDNHDNARFVEVDRYRVENPEEGDPVVIEEPRRVDFRFRLGQSVNNL